MSEEKLQDERRKPIERVHTKTVRDKDATRQRILDAAEAVFAEKGYHGAVVDDIVRAADTSKGGFYFHFPNKQGIFLALMAALTPRLIKAVEQAITQETASVAKLDAALYTVLDTFSRHRRLSKILLIEAVGLGHGFDEKLMEVHAQFASLIQKYLDQAIAEGAIAPIDTRLTSFAWLGAINEIVIHWVVTSDPGGHLQNTAPLQAASPLQDVIPSLRALLLRSIGVDV